MIEAFKDIKHGGSSYNNIGLERTASQILHHIEDKDSEDSIDSCRRRVLSNARVVYGSSRPLDIITFAATSSRSISAAIVEHHCSGRTFVHCASAKESSRAAAIEHLLVITEDIIQRMFDAQGIESSGWLPLSAQGAVAAGAVAASSNSSRRPSIDVGIPVPAPVPVPMSSMPRSNSEIIRQPVQQVPRSSSDIMYQPSPLSLGRQVVGPRGRVKWNLGSEG
ncbi:hypothetical protein AOQ84DRAFT_432894 [Glonium stellatum]|uniref:Uncharacterized protein n=1 Tax=Glonium stellatum TaxID=574774 RepID=A0A8E2EWC7_9PEZI|nr:hypothetical protein AOQ84DRAFT_432894 [Glonium stellatum]